MFSPSNSPSVVPLAPAESRYPKRKRADVVYNDENDADEASDFELELVPLKRRRTRTTKARPPHKMFPFLKLPAELRNRIYAECLPSPTEVPAEYEGDKEGIWFGCRQQYYRKTIGYIPWVSGESALFEGGREENSRWLTRGGTARGTGRGHRRRPAVLPPTNEDGDSDSDAGEEHGASPEKLGLTLLAVCKQIYDEAAPMMYSRSLVFTGTDALFSFASRLSPRTAKLLCSIEIRTWGMTRSRKSRGYAAMAMLAAKGVTNLSSLYINCRIAYFHTYWRGDDSRTTPVPKRIAKKVYRDCHLWLEAIGAASGDVFKGVEVLKVNEWMFDYGGVVPERDLEMYKKELRRLLKVGAW